MRSYTCLDTKDIAESDVISFNFAPSLATGETIASVTSVLCEVFDGTDANPSGVLSGGAQISGLTVLQAVQGGVRYVKYHIRCVVMLSSGRVLALSCLLPVDRL